MGGGKFFGGKVSKLSMAMGGEIRRFLREALYPSGSEEKLMSVLRSSFVLKKIIDFCEGDLGGVTRLLSTGSLNL